ncbi:MAG: RNase J family beta-CASP ribonuclease [Deltaproteobacteria bacterium]|nr:RNase J family beta-CASP ribonuclease [Deltaproteobacteria bacterium]
MMLLEYDDSVIVIDCGLMFPGADLLGIDLVIPDISYLIEAKKKLHAIVLTHAHEDHIGALPYVLKQLPVPIYGSPLTLGLLRNKLREHNLEKNTTLHEISAGQPWELGPFRLEGIRVTHSLLHCLALAIETPVGVVIHTGDFKIDPTPMDGELFDAKSFAAYGDKGVLLLLSDSTNVERRGHTRSEREVGKNLEGLFSDCTGRIFISTFSSNIPRIQQVVDVSERFDRTLVLSGRSMLSNARIASELGCLRLPDDTLTENENWQDLATDQLAFLTTGSQGEPLSVLHRVALDDHKWIKLERGDTVILSARVIPGNEKTISNLIDHLYRRGAEVHYETVSDVHVSGHASQDELKTMIDLTRPRYFIPIHGEYRNLVRHINLACDAGIAPENCFLLEDGEVLELTRDRAERAEPVTVGKVFVDGKGIGDVEDVVLRDRRHLSEQGMVLVVLAIHQQSGELVAGPDLISRGFTGAEEGEEILEQAKTLVLECLGGLSREIRTDPLELKEELRKTLRRYFNKILGRRPVVVPLIMEM